MAKKLSTQRKGKRAEYEFFIMLLDRGYELFIPLADDNGVDALVRLENGNIIEIQIKSRSPGVVNPNLFADLNYKPGRSKYWFVFHNWKDDADTWWLLSRKDFESKAKEDKEGKYSITLNPKNKTLDQYKLTCKRWKEFALQ